MFTHIAAKHIPFEWERLGVLLAPAIAQDTKVTVKAVYNKLCAGRCHCFDVTLPNARGALVFEIFEEDERIICWSSYIAGSVDGGPKQWLTTMRSIMADFETRIKAAGCVENRIGGRDWSRVFPDYRLFDEATNELRKAL